MLLDASQSQLVLVDYQAQLMPAIFEADAVAQNAVRLGKMARLFEVPVWGTEHNPSKLGENRARHSRAVPANLAQDAFQRHGGGPRRMAARTGQGAAGQCPQPAQAPAEARGRGRRAQHHRDCRLRSACLPAADRARSVWKTSSKSGSSTDACSSRTERNRDAAFDRLAGAGAELVTTEMVGFEWLRTAEHPAFRRAAEDSFASSAALHLR